MEQVYHIYTFPQRQGTYKHQEILYIYGETEYVNTADTKWTANFRHDTVRSAVFYMFKDFTFLYWMFASEYDVQQ